MKNLIITLILGIFLFAGCNEEIVQPRAWLLTSPDRLDTENNEVIARIELNNADGVGFGIESFYSEDSQIFGAFALQEYQLIDVLDSRQYIGGRTSISAWDDDSDGNYYGFMTGVIVPVTKNIESIVETQWNEYQDNFAQEQGTDDDIRVFAGLRVRF